MSDDSSGAGQGALPPRDGPPVRGVAERPALRLAQIPGQIVFTSQSHVTMPAFTQISGSTGGNPQQGTTRIISLNSGRIGTITSPLRPSVANQNIVNALTKPRPQAAVRLQLFPAAAAATTTAVTSPVSTTLKRPLPSPDERAAKLQRLTDHRNVRSKIVREKYNEHLTEKYFLESQGNILDLPAFTKRPRTAHFIAYLQERSIEIRDVKQEEMELEPPRVPTPHINKTVIAPIVSESSPVQIVTAAPSQPSTTPSESSHNLQRTTSVSNSNSSVKVTPRLSISSSGQDPQLMEKARQEATVLQRVSDLQKEGLWSEKRLPKVQEQPRVKAHWDFLLEEMVWLAADFAQERKWKKAAAKKCARMVQKHFQDKVLAAQRAEKAQEQHLRRVAAFCAKEIRNFWSSVEKLVEFKQNSLIEAKRKRALDQHLSFIVDQTEKYSQLLAEGMNKSVNVSTPSAQSSAPASRVNSDDEFDPDQESTDDEETIAQEEATSPDAQNQSEEIAALQRESEMDMDAFLSELPKDYLKNRSKIAAVEEEDSSGDEGEDDDEEEEEEKDEDSNSEESEEAVRKTETGKVGLKSLVVDSKEGEAKTDKNDLINDAAAIAESIQPKGNTLSSTSVVTPIPFLLKYTLREYQHIGLDWLVTMYERKLNGILADEMGLGKTIQTIALLAHLACEKGNWGPHLIIVPTSVMLNWEMECKKWCPAFKILTYYGSQKERKQKRIGWTKPNAFHICITSYKLVIQDHQSFRRKKWKYLILDEAQNIKNFKSQRWQLLLNFQSQQRLLLTGTPLQNNLMELWSLMHFLMPHVFQSHREFREWFSNPVTGMIEGNSEYNESIIKRLHKVLRPFLLRRLKCEVEKQMPKKYEHVVMCRLSKRQRFLYDDYMSRAKTRETLVNGNLLSVINVLMQLRKVCNHPNLFEVRPTTSPFQCEGITWHVPSCVYGMLEYDVWKHINLSSLNLNLLLMELFLSAYQCYRMRQYQTPRKLIEEIDSTSPDESPYCPPAKLSMRVHKIMPTPEIKQELKNEETTTSTVPGLVVRTPQATNTQANLKFKITPTQGMALQVLQNPTQLKGVNPGVQRVTVMSNKDFPSSAVVGGNKVVKLHVNTLNSPASNAVPVAPATTKTVGTRFIDRLYSRNLDVRWRKKFIIAKKNNQQGEIEITDYRKNKLELLARVNDRRCGAVPLYGKDFHDSIKIFKNNEDCAWNGGRIHCLNALYNLDKNNTTDCLKDLLYSPERRIEQLKEITNRFVFYVPAVCTPEPSIKLWHPQPSLYWGKKRELGVLTKYFSKPATCLHPLASAMVTQFPDPRLIQYDCGKLQTLNRLLRQLKTGSHRVLIFTQMTKMLDVLEAFLNFHGHIYLRLDGSTKVDQRQVLMERFNGDPRIFVFILSTRSGGIGVNLTGADTVIFYDSDWNPTMDAQAQDRCHRIGQTRDVHIYRLVSERTIEENILKKANQKRLLGDLAIEGGNFTTAFFKTSTIQDLFEIDNSEESAANRMSEVIATSKERERQREEPKDERVAIGALESALAACEDDQDVQAATTAKAEAVADLAEFDETIPLEEQQEKEKEPEISKAEQEVENIVKQLTPIEKYAMRFIEETEAAFSAAQLAAAEKEIEEQKREWEQNRLTALREEEERRARELEEENDLLTYSREDATNQIWVSDNTMEQMPMWCPPTPPQQDTDVYIDPTLTFLYDSNVMSETQLPPVYIRRDCKRSRLDANLIDPRRVLKIPRKEDSLSCAPRSIFERPSPALVKMRRDLKLKKHLGGLRPTVPIPGVKVPVTKPPTEVPVCHNWTIHEDMSLLKVIQSFQGLPLNLMLISPGHTPNWDFVADYVNAVSITYRTPKQCRQRYESVIIPREEGKQTFDSAARKKKNKSSLYKFPTPTKTNKPMRTSQLYSQDNNSSFTQLMIQRYDSLKTVSNKRAAVTKSVYQPSFNSSKHAALLNECGIDIEHPVLPVEVAQKRAERLAREKKTITPEMAQRLQLIKAGQQAHATPTTASPSVTTQSTQSPVTQSPQVVTQATSTVTTTPVTSAIVVTAASTPSPTQIRQRIVASPIQTGTPTVVSVSGLSPAQLAATQRLIAAGSPGQGKTVVGGTATVQGKTISPAQLQMLRQVSLKQHFRFQGAGLAQQAMKTATVTIAGQTAVQVQLSQAQPRAQFVKQGTVAVTGKQGTRTVTEGEISQLLKRQQQQKAAAGGSQTTTIQPQVFTQTIQSGSAGTQVATLVKAVSTSGGNLVTIPVSTVTIGGAAVKAALAPGTKPSPTAATPQQLRQLQLQHQLAQKKLVSKGGVATQLIVGSKPLTTGMTMQQFQVMRSSLGGPQGPVVLAKGPPRVIPVNAGQGAKQTIQVVATSQALANAIRPQNASALTSALAGIKVQGSAGASQAAQHPIFSQVSAVLQGQAVGVRQGSPVRIQTAGGTPLVAVTVQSSSLQQQQQPQSGASTPTQTSIVDQSRFKK